MAVRMIQKSFAWPGLTEKGNLTHRAIRQVENAIAEVERAQESLAVLTRRQENALRRCWLVLGDLRYLREPCSSARLQERADAWRRDHICYGGEEDRP